MRHFYYLKVGEIARLAGRKLLFMAKDRLGKKERGGRFYSVRSVANFFNIDNFFIDYNVNQPAYLAKIEAYMPDIVISSNSLYFGKKLLDLPVKFCVNRHSALLPTYGGLWPVFHAFRCNEDKVGVSVHIMQPKLDSGAVLSQIEVPVKGDDSLADLYEKCFASSVDAVLQALEKVRNGDLNPVKNQYQSSYYSFPTRENWRDFRRRGGRFI
jgi:methionyl-tRNA formyltransferase